MLHWYETLNQLGRVASEMEGRANYADCCRLQLALTFVRETLFINLPSPSIYLSQKTKTKTKQTGFFPPHTSRIG